ncbi:flippase [Anabaena sp. CCY 9402-a]|uniref:flippase n=1 Tax=Anabaena sp. CCY 9402-a TaxID=3103867 RepID=UPI0039C72F14
MWQSPNKLAELSLKNIQKRLDINPELQKLISNTIWLFCERGLHLLLALFIGVLLARYLGTEQFGIYNFAAAFLGMFSPFTQLGLNGILTRDIVKKPEIKDEILGTAFLLRLFGALLTLVIALIFIRFLRPNDLNVQLLILFLLIGNFFDPFQIIDFWFESKVLSKYVVIANSSALLIFYGLNLTLVLIKAPLITFAITLAIKPLINSIFLVVAYQYCKNKLLNWKFNFVQAKILLSQSWLLIISSFGAVIYLKIDQIMLAQMTTVASVGIYSVAVRLSEVWYFIPTAIVASLFPSLVKIREQEREIYYTKLQKIYDLLVYTALVLAIPITFLGTPVIKLLYGNAYEEAGLILSIHIWASVFIFMRALLSKWLIVENMFIFSFVTHASGAVINILLNFILIPQLGGVGAAIATVLAYATASYFALFFHPKTWEMACMMTKALLAPIRNIRNGNVH